MLGLESRRGGGGGGKKGCGDEAYCSLYSLDATLAEPILSRCSCGLARGSCGEEAVWTWCFASRFREERFRGTGGGSVRWRFTVQRMGGLRATRFLMAE